MVDKDNTGFDMKLPIDMSAIMQIQQNSFKTFNDIHQMFLTGTSTYNEELLKFINKRFKEDMETCNQFADCTKPQDIYTVYTKFLQTAVSQYMEEAERISAIGNKVFSDAMNVVENTAGEEKKAAEKSVKKKKAGTVKVADS